MKMDFQFEIGEKVMGLASSLGLPIVVVGKVLEREHRFAREYPNLFIGNQYKVMLDKDILPMESYPESIATVEGFYYLTEFKLMEFNQKRFERALEEWFLYNALVHSTDKSKSLLVADMYGKKNLGRWSI
jgi:hypothetical protein